MKKRNKSWIYPLIMGFVLMLISGCENDNEKVVLPVLTTTSVSTITQTTARSGGVITAGGGGAITARGVCWGTSNNPTTADSKMSNGTGTGSFAGILTGLTANTTYYVRAYATNSLGTAYGESKMFTTPELSAPVLTTISIDAITQTTASCGGMITSDMGDAITQRGVCWSTSENPTTADTKTSNGTGVGLFSSNLISLTPGATYYVRAYAVNSLGTGYGESKTFSTPSAETALVETSMVGAITQYTARTGGTVTFSGGTPVSARGICWSVLNAIPTTANSTVTSNGSGLGNFSTSLAGLLPNTTYYVRAYAINGTGTAYGDVNAFTTPVPYPPVPTTIVVTGITESTAISGGTITGDMGAPVTARGLCWNIAAGPTTSNSKTTDGSGLGSFASNMTGLLGSTTYYVRAYGTNTAGTGYGNEVTFTTPAPILSVLTTTAASAITSGTVTGGGNITNTGGATITERGVCWSTTNTTPTTADTKLSSGTGPGVFVANVNSLLGSTTYYMRAYSTTTIVSTATILGTSYGSVVSFTTLAPVVPVLAATTAVTAIAKTTATSGGNVTNTGGAAVTERGLCWNTVTNPTTANSKLAVGNGFGTFTGNLTGLVANTTYYVRSYAINSLGTAYGTVVSFKTLP